jgi:hypothetical protein
VTEGMRSVRLGRCRLARLVQGRLVRNPLRRGSDRAETVMLGVLVAAFLAVAPFAANAAGSWAYVTSAQEAQAQQAGRSQVPVTLLQAPSHVTVYPAAGYAPSAPSHAGGRRTGRHGPASCSLRPARPRAVRCRCGSTGPAN